MENSYLKNRRTKDIVNKKLRFVLLITLALYASCAQNTSASSMRAFGATITAVIDGDTVKVKFVGTIPAGCAPEERVRLIGVNTPELSTEIPEYYAQEARDYTNRWWKAPVKVEIDMSRATRDVYGRLLAYVYVQDSLEPLNMLLIRNGFARYYGNFAFDAERMKAYAAAEAKAKSQRLGLWQRL
ncbi:MAG: hypothetical protein Ta2A_07820 [Treponemataceae bacterium]|nr:MAG: hypothetical protein Ta2A_07820 [Treponemataceae bacterium]